MGWTQVLAAEDPLEADSEKAEAAEVLKHQAWLEASLKTNREGLEKLNSTAQKLGIQLFGPQLSQADKAVESYILERIVFEDEKLQLAQARTALSQKVHLTQLQQAAAANQRAVQGATQNGTSQSRPAAVPVQQNTSAKAWPVAISSTPPPAQAGVSGFRSFSIMGKPKAPS